MIRSRRHISFPEDALQIAAGGTETIWKPNPLSGIFSPGMAKRTSAGPFATAPSVAGKLDGTGTPDALTFPRGALLGNQTEYFYANFDPYQATIPLWIVPEWDGNDGIEHNILYVSAAYRIFKTTGDLLQVTAGGQTATVDISAWTAGTLYHVVISWNVNKTLDGTNYARISINNAHTYGMSTQPTVTAPSATIGIGSEITPALASDAIIGNPTIYRRVLFDGTYGVDIGNGNELTLIYAAGAGSDPCLITGSFDVCFCLPTNSTAGAIVTGTGEAWSHPHASNIPDVWGMWDGGLPGTPYCVECSATKIDCGSGVTLDDLADNEFTVDVVFRVNSYGANETLIQKGDLATGWSLRLLTNDTIRVDIQCATTDALSIVTFSNFQNFAVAGKFHILTIHFDDAGTRQISIAVDGAWASAYITQNAGTGAVVSDAADNLTIASFANNTSQAVGAVAWAALWSDDHHVVGTDFIPPRIAPAPGGNLVECWHMDEGTGVAVVAQVTSPANDGTITAGTWSSIWEIEGTPVVPQSVEFNGTTTNLDATSGANIDNLPSGANGFTAEGYFRADDAGESNNGTFWNKTSWYMRFDSASTIRVFIDYDNVDIDETFSWIPDGVKHHWMLTYNENGADRFARVYCDGVLVHTTAASVGNYVADATNTLYIGNNAGGTATFDGGIGWQALSDLVRVSATFTPNGSEAPRANDANMHLRYAMTDGAGIAVADTSGNAYNGTLTNYVWNNTPDMAIDEPGARIFNNGYNVGSDGANDGLTDIEVVVAETDYVTRLILSLGQSGRAWPEIYLWDNPGAAQIGATYPLPRCHDVHTGGNNLAILINANGSFTQQLVGWELYNITDGSSTTITAVSGDKTTITGALAGGIDNDWDTNDVYLIRPPGNGNYCDFPFATENIFVSRTPIACVSMDSKVRNAAGEGVMQVQQMEVLASLLDNGDHEAAAGNPAILTGWTNDGLDAGDVETDAVTVHAGAQSLEWNPGAILGEGQYETITTTIGKFLAFAGWTYGDGVTGFRIGAVAAARGLMQYSLSAFNLITAIGAFWSHAMSVFRALHANPRLQIEADAIAGDGFSDDFYAYELNDVAVTVTPASEANSAEGTGRRVDGIDSLLNAVPAGRIRANNGDVRINITPRHTDVTTVLFGNGAPTILTIFGDANNYIVLLWSAASTIQLAYNANGGGVVTNTWATGGAFFAAGVQHEFRIKWTNAGMQLYVDDVLRTTIIAPTGFVWPATIAYWGSTETSVNQVDAVFSVVT